MMGWNVTGLRIDWRATAGPGGRMPGIQGFVGFGALAAVVALIGSCLALILRCVFLVSSDRSIP
jgi:hypothetical protein